MWRKSLSHLIQIISKDTEGRAITIKLNCIIDGQNLLIACVYFPCSDTFANYKASVGPLHAYITDVLESFPNSLHMIGGDFNFSCFPGELGYETFMSSCVLNSNLSCCDNQFSGSNIYTYAHATLNHKSWVDHFFISDGLKNYTSHFNNIDAGDNLSDHMPISCLLCFDICINGDTSKENNSFDLDLYYRDRWDKADIMLYYYLSGCYLQQISVPKDILSSNVCSSNMLILIDEYYNAIANALKLASLASVPKIKHSALKAFWNEDLDDLKQQSIDWHKIWSDCGKPRTGVVNSIRLHIKYKYKVAIQNAAQNFEQRHSDELFDNWSTKNSSDFWKCWNSKYKKHLDVNTCINGSSDNASIAESFRVHLSSIYNDSGHQSSKGKSGHTNFDIYNRSNNEVTNFPFSIETVELAIKSLKLNKAAGHDGIVSEHIVHSHPALVIHLKILFSMILKTGHVTDDFGKGIVIPIIKDKSGNPSSIDNYRPITLSSVISKVFEHCLISLFSKFIVSDNLQFGFKPGIGCSHSIFTLRTVCDYFNQRGSDVYIASLDATKAFDKVNHAQLFSLLLAKNVPLCFIHIIIDWYSKLFAVVRWNNAESVSFPVKSGVRQGGVLSPILFNFYINDLITSLKKTDMGCHVRDLYVGCKLYADNILLLSGSLNMLQDMLDTCYSISQDLYLSFNSTKSYCIIVGSRKIGTPAELMLHNRPLEWTSKLKYLVIVIISGSPFSVCLDSVRKKYFAAINALNAHCKYVAEPVKLHLYESYCLPILLYGIDCINLSSQQSQEFEVCWNNAYRKIFGYKLHESVKMLICLMQRLDFRKLYDLRRLMFITKLSQTKHDIICSLLPLFQSFEDIHVLFHTYDLTILSNPGAIKFAVFSHFEKICFNQAQIHA